MLRVSLRGLDIAKQKMKLVSERMRPELEESLLRITMSAHRVAVMLASGPVIKVRSGFTRASIKWAFDKSKLRGTVGSKEKHMRQIEHGGIITPKRARYLTIPLPAAQTKAGVNRKSIREYEGFFKRTDSGELFFFEDRGEDARPVPMFKLVRWVNQKPKRLFELTLERVQPDAERGTDEAVRRTLREVFG